MASKNFAIANLANLYDAAAVSVDVVTGQGARFPSVPFPAVWYNATDYARPSDDPNVEVVTVTAIAGDTLTIARGAEGTSASTKNTLGKTYKIFGAFTAALYDALLKLTGGTLTGPLEAPAYRDTIATLTYAASVALDFSAGTACKLSLTGNVTLTTSNLAAGRMFKLYIFADSTDRTLTFPASWIWLSSIPANVPASKMGILSLEALGTTDADVIAVYAPQTN